MSKYKVGDKVKILDGSNIRDYRGDWYDEEMKRFVGTTDTIEKIVEPLHNAQCVGYFLKGNTYMWDERGLELAESPSLGGNLMTLEELEKKRAELDAQIAERKAQNEKKPTPPHPRWKPKDYEIYYTIMFSCGKIDVLNWSDTKAPHEDRFKLGNVYKTRAEAEFAAERMRVLTEMREWAGEWRSEYNLAWDNDKIIIHASLFYHGELCFATREDAEGCIKAVGEERIKKYYFMIPEETNND